MASITSQAQSSARMAALPAIVSALLLGMVVIYGVGLAQADALHNAAHDGRHAFAFPCH